MINGLHLLSTSFRHKTQHIQCGKMVLCDLSLKIKYVKFTRQKIEIQTSLIVHLVNITTQITLNLHFLCKA